MSLEDPTYLDQGSEESDEVPKKPLLTYSREFLLSFSSLDICKKLPSGFDESILSEFEDPLLNTADLSRIPGSLSLQGYRKDEYGSSPPTREDSSNYSRGIHGSRSCGRSDRDSDSRVDRGAESGRSYVHPSRRSWQTPEQHDGLLGSGSFPRPSLYATEVSASKMRTNEQYQLSKSREPYHPPRPYKVVAHSWRDTDAYNDETFGSSETASEDKVEEERRRRASFELIRKEQQKALQENQKMNLKKHNVVGISEHAELLKNDEDEKEPFVRINESEVSAASVLNNNSELPSFALPSTASKPLVPPGFCNDTEDESSELKTLILPSSSVVAKRVTETSLMGVEGNLIQNGRTDFDIVWQSPEMAQHTTLSNKLEKAKSHENLDVPSEKHNFKCQFSTISSHFDSYGNLKGPEFSELNAVVLDDKILGDSKGSDSTSILEKNFGGTLSMHDACSSSTELDDGSADVVRSPAQSSKFAQCFFEKEDEAAADNISSARPNDILSFVTGDIANGNFDPIRINGPKEKLLPTGLTCEDLEQSILSGSDAGGRNTQPLNSWSSNGAVTDQPGEHVDNHVSLQLLSILKSSTENNSSLKSGEGINMTAILPVSHKHDRNPTVEDNIHSSSPNLGRLLSLETIFGTAFMEELQSVGTPLSAQRGSIGSGQGYASEPHGLTHQFPDIENSWRVVNEIHISGFDNSNDYGNLTKQSKAQNWPGFNDHIKIRSSGPISEAVSKHSGLEAMYLHLPEDNLISASNAPNHQVSSFMGSGNSPNSFNFSSNAPPTYRTNITDKYAAFGGGVNDEVARFSSEVRHGSFDSPDCQIPYRNIPGQRSLSPKFGPQQVNQAWQPFHRLESHSTHMGSSSEEFFGQDSIFSHNSPSDRQVLPDMIRPQFHHLNPGFEASPRQPMMHRMQMPRGYPPLMQMNHAQGLGLGPPHMPNIGGHLDMPRRKPI